VAERPGQDAAYVIDSTKARTELGWTPRISLDAGLREVTDWVAANWDTISGMTLDYVHKA
jgi:dTDP-glucose 4,6-dehydratase